MNEYIDKIEHIFKKNLLKTIKLSINKKVYKEGQFTLFNYNFFHLNLHLKNFKKNKHEILKIPLPFNVHYMETENRILFDYRLSTFTYNNKVLENLILSIAKPPLSRYYNNILVLEIKND